MAAFAVEQGAEGVDGEAEQLGDLRDRNVLIRVHGEELHQRFVERKQGHQGRFVRRSAHFPEYVSWLAAKILGESLHRFLREKQVEHAVRLLRRTPLSIEEIAARSGFGTRSTMHRWFVEAYGIGPAAFREGE